ncbi:LicD family-domain-containing protein [Sordaria sp. MPI-SDFR-AT-0083]|nr:LicD family-domain-containing protein [Sordaria sp. MPI-SDFR-AT-0083]
MLLNRLLVVATLCSLGTSAPLEPQDALTILDTTDREDMSGKAGDPPQKYFHESTFDPHYDGRFAEKALGYQEQKAALKNLVRTFLETMRDLGIETWLMHGSLLGWWWNKQIMPWDSDVDVQVTEPSMYFLATYYNMSVFHYKTPRLPAGRNYMLEVNPNFSNGDQSDWRNVIDARWIDTESGLFIDITTARYNLTHPEGQGMMSCKDGHEFRVDLSPTGNHLRRSCGQDPVPL